MLLASTVAIAPPVDGAASSRQTVRADQPVIELKPAAGPPRSKFSVRGRGFPGGRRIVVSYAGRKLVKGRVGTAGRFRLRVRARSSPTVEPIKVKAGGATVKGRFDASPRRPSLPTGQIASAGGLRLDYAPLAVERGSELRVALPAGEPRGAVIRLPGAGFLRLREGGRGQIAIPSEYPTGMARLSVGSGGTRLQSGLRVVRGPRLPLTAAFYYPWYPEAWRQRGLFPFTHYMPAAGLYDSGDPRLVARHVADMRYGRIDAAIASWWGFGTNSDERVPLLLAAAAGTPFRWALYYEREARATPAVGELVHELTAIKRRYGRHPSYLRIRGSFVIFVYGAAEDRTDMARRWMAAAREVGGVYVVLKVFPGYRSTPYQPDSWHQYAPATARDVQPGYSQNVSPGFWLRDESAPRLVRDPRRFSTDVREMYAGDEPWRLITSFNEWGEGTAVEPAESWASASGHGTYLDILRRFGARRP